MEENETFLGSNLMLVTAVVPSFQFNSVQFKMVSMRLKKPIIYALVMDDASHKTADASVLDNTHKQCTHIR